ncbi:unnamed protein product [Rhizophagus irregularis]|nr:unnamed protein product [Rhizophagus irregularis]
MDMNFGKVGNPVLPRCITLQILGSFWLPQMNEYPNKNSVIVMDNAKIHHDEKLVESIEQMGCKVLYLPPYSPDYNPIEMAFSGVKSWLKKNRTFVKIVMIQNIHFY